MGRFSSKYIDYRYLGDEKVKMLKDFIYYPDKKYGYKPVTIPKGFVSDLMSIPDFLRSIIHKFGDTQYGALPHDRIYHIQDRPRAEADHIFLLALTDANKLPHLRIPLWKRRAAYRGVRSGGWVPWKKRAKKLKKIKRRKKCSRKS